MISLKQTTLLFLLLGAYCFATAQQVVLEKSFMGTRLVDQCIALEEGYLLLSHTERRDPKAHPGNLTAHAFLKKQSLTKLNAQMEPVWEQSFVEAQVAPYHKLATVPGGFLAFGTQKGSETQAQLTKFDERGSVVWQQAYPYPGYQSSHANVLHPLPDGSAYLLVNVFKHEHSTLKTVLMKVDTQGELTWSQLYGKSAPGGGLSHLVLTRENQLALLGTTYPSQKSWSRGASEGWFMTLDPSRPSAPLLNERVAALPNCRLNHLVTLESGKFLAIGQSQGPVLVQLSAQGAYEKHLKLTGETPFFPKDLAWNAARGTFVIAGISGNYEGADRDFRKVRLLELTPDWEVVRDVECQPGTFLGLEVLDSGEMLLVASKGVRVIV